MAFSVGLGVVFQNSILAESSQLRPVTALKNDSLPKYYYDDEAGIYKVKVGGGGGRIIVMDYYPQNLQVNVGDTVEFYNPTTVLEPHTVTFISDSNYVPTFAGPYRVEDSESITALPNEINSEPLIVPLDEQTNAVLAINARGFFPYVVDSDGTPINLGPNTSYAVDGTEKYVNSGWILPKVFLDDIPGSSETFTVTFEETGNFPYICILHPWMSGQIVVVQ